MVDRPRDQFELLKRLANQLADSGVILQDLHWLLLRKARDAYSWAHEFGLLAVLPDLGIEQDGPMQRDCRAPVYFPVRSIADCRGEVIDRTRARSCEPYQGQWKLHPVDLGTLDS
ncbi:hypothetical protein [Pseudomonas graminis]|uniref:hypothetical protein n=1 Tax=Pseudomonas graminis TaxID=158627 RepID=UPI003C221D29